MTNDALSSLMTAEGVFVIIGTYPLFLRALKEDFDAVGEPVADVLQLEGGGVWG